MMYFGTLVDVNRHHLRPNFYSARIPYHLHFNVQYTRRRISAGALLTLRVFSGPGHVRGVIPVVAASGV